MKINKKALELIEKGLSSKTVSKLDESQINILHTRLVGEQVQEIPSKKSYKVGQDGGNLPPAAKGYNVKKTETGDVVATPNESEMSEQDDLQNNDALGADAMQSATGQETPHMADDMAPDGMDDDSDDKSMNDYSGDESMFEGKMTIKPVMGKLNKSSLTNKVKKMETKEGSMMSKPVVGKGVKTGSAKFEYKEGKYGMNKGEKSKTHKGDEDYTTKKGDTLKDLQKIGVSYFEPMDNFTDTNEFDVPLSCCITPWNTYAFE